ncbi:uncharacterized protein [Aegilops tauschii subsp. strangulata]|uniref:uncharacterized protein n=1 Tax=Aegilops tauschii subsp. strangulata TaxID=200361 RepID=UPI003CC84472
MPARRRSARLRSQIHASEVHARPRSARLRPQIDANEDGAGVASHRRSSKRRSTQIQAREGADRVTRRRGSGKLLRPQIQASDDGAEMTSRRTSPEPAASLPDNEDMLWEIFLRIPLDLCSLPRASAVCKQWRGILVDPKFLRRFYAHHRKPPLLGFFPRGGRHFTFTSVLPPSPDRISPGSFFLGQCYSNSEMLDCRHGRVLLYDWVLEELIVCDPITNNQHRVSIPPEFNKGYVNAAVLCSASDQNHVHGACHSTPFKLVFVSMYYTQDYRLLTARVYSSETNTWGSSISTGALDHTLFVPCPSTLVGNALYWPAMHMADAILEFDLGTQKLTVIKGPCGTNMYDSNHFHIIEAEGGVVGLAAVSQLKLQMWQRKLDCRGVAMWLKGKTVSLRKLLKIPPQTLTRNEWLKVVGYDEDTDVIFLARYDGIYMVQPKSMQARKLNGTGSTYYCYTFTSSYPLGTTIEGGANGAEMLG